MKQITNSILTIAGILLLSGAAFGYGGGLNNRSTVSRAATFSVVVEGLHSPRGLAFGPGDILYVAQAGDDSHQGSIIQIPNSMSRNSNFRTLLSAVHVIGGEGEFIG